jgi:hypothetical protein
MGESVLLNMKEIVYIHILDNNQLIHLKHGNQNTQPGGVQGPYFDNWHLLLPAYYFAMHVDSQARARH